MRSIYRFIYKQTRGKKNNQSVFLFQLLQFDYEIWEIIIYFTTCFSFWRLFYSLPTFCTKYIEVGPLAETYFFLLKTTQIWVITIVVVLDPNTVTFQKGLGNIICVVLDQSTVIFQKRGGITICVVLVIRSKSWQCYVLSVGF